MIFVFQHALVNAVILTLYITGNSQNIHYQFFMQHGILLFISIRQQSEYSQFMNKLGKCQMGWFMEGNEYRKETVHI